MQSQLIKSLGTSQNFSTPLDGGIYASKSLGGGTANPELASYYENELLPYWQAVQSGEIEISAEEYQQLEEYLQYCQNELGLASSGWGEMPGSSASGGAPNQGALGQATFTQDKNEFTVDGSAPVIDVWGSEAILNVPPPCTVTFETTTDTRFNPPETLVKAVVTNPAMQGPDGQPKQSVVFIHDGAEITCNASKKADGTSRATDNTGTVTIGKYQDVPESNTPESSVPGVEQENGDLLYQSEFYDPNFLVDFFSQPGDNQTHVVNGNANISVPPNSTVAIDEQGGRITVVVTHADGSTDSYDVSGTVNVNAEPSSVEIEGQAFEDVPAELSERLTINGTANADGETKGTDPQAMVDALLGACSPRTEEELLSSLNSADFPGGPFDKIEDLYAAIEAGDFPGDLNSAEDVTRLFNFLSILDPELAPLVMQLKTAHGDEIDALYGQFRDRIVTLFDTILFPNDIVVNGPGPGEFYVGQQGYGWYYNEDTGKFVVEMYQEQAPEEDQAVEDPADQESSSIHWTNYSASLDYMASLSGVSRNSPEFFMKLRDIYGANIDAYDNNPKDGVLSDEEFKNMLEAGYLLPPTSPDLNFVRLLYKLDPTLNEAIETYRSVSNSWRDSGYPDFLKPALEAAHKKVRDRLVELLKGSYGTQANICAGDSINDILFNGQQFDVYINTTTGKLAWDVG